MKIKFLDELSCYLLPGKYYGETLKDVYLGAYEFWQFWWQKTFTEIDIEFPNTSDEFCRHEKVIILCENKKIIGLAMMDQFDLQNPVHLNYRYFKKYPSNILEHIKHLSLEQPISTFEYLAITPEYRKKFFIADLIMGIAVKSFLKSNHNIMIGYSRNLKKTNDLMYRLGAKALQKGLTINGEDSDFVYFDKASINSLNNHIAYETIEKLWAKKTTDLTYYYINDQKTFLKGDPYEQDHFQ